MKVPFSWLKELVDIDVTAQELEEKLFSCGFEVEELIPLADVIGKVPGVARVSCGFKCERDLDEMTEAALAAMAEAGEFDTFKVAARRNHTDFVTGSMDMNQIIGSALCAAHPEKSVKMKKPDVTVGVEVVQNAAYVYARSLPGVGGLPVGSSGLVVSLPDFDAANVGESLTAPDSPLLNRAFSAYAVGSVFKPVLAAAALEIGRAHV